MKRIITDIVFGLLFISVFHAALQHNENELRPASSVYETLLECFRISKELNKRESITFILGEDKKSNNPYYEEASNYYRFNSAGQTEYFVNHCRSLIEVREYLVNHPPANGKPWGLINLVSHGNEWMGMSVNVTPISKRATPDRLQAYIDKAAFETIPGKVVDDRSELFIHGCGLGNNKKFINLVSKAFSGPHGPMRTRASKLYEYYTSERYGNIVKSSERYMAQSYSLSFKMGYEPSKQSLIGLLNKKYPNTDVDWEDALTREQPRWPGDAYHFTFQVPVKWVIPFPNQDSLPDVSTKAKQLTWIQSQPEIKEKLDEIGIPVTQFNWWFRQVYVDQADGKKAPAIWLKGYCTILSVLQALAHEDDLSPVAPGLDDEKFYTTSL